MFESTMMAKVVHLAVISLFLSYSSSSASKETEETLKSNKNLNVIMGMEEKARTSNDMDRRRETEGNLTRIFSSTLIPKFVLGDLSDIGVFEAKPNPEVSMVLFILLLLSLTLTALFYLLLHLCRPCSLPIKSPYEEI